MASSTTSDEKWTKNDQLMDSQNLDKSMKDLNWLVQLGRPQPPPPAATSAQSSRPSSSKSSRSNRSKHGSGSSLSRAPHINIVESPVRDLILASSPEVQSIMNQNTAIQTKAKKRSYTRKNSKPSKRPKKSATAQAFDSGGGNTPQQEANMTASGDPKLEDLEAEIDLSKISGIGLPDKPTHSYATLITLAISSSSRKMMTLAEIYSWICQNFPFFNNCTSKWKNSIRHNLSLNRNFIRVPRPKEETGKGSYWTTTKYRQMHAKALNELHQKQLANLSESFKLLYQQSFQPILSESRSRILENDKQPVMINPRAAQIAEMFSSQNEKQLKSQSKASAKSKNPDPPAIPARPKPAALTNLEPSFNKKCDDLKKELQKSMNKGSGLIKQPKQEDLPEKLNQPLNNLMNSFRKANEANWNLSKEHLSNLYSGVSNLCKATGGSTTDLLANIPENLEDFLNLNTTLSDAEFSDSDFPGPSNQPPGRNHQDFDGMKSFRHETGMFASNHRLPPFMFNSSISLNKNNSAQNKVDTLAEGLSNFNGSKLLQKSYQNALDSLMPLQSNSNFNPNKRLGPGELSASKNHVSQRVNLPKLTNLADLESTKIINDMRANQRPENQGALRMDNLAEAEEEFDWDNIIEGEPIKLDDLEGNL